MTCFRMPDGKTLHQWCIEHRVSYHTLYSRIDDFGLSVEEAINYKPDPYKQRRIKLMYKGVPLVDYCGGCKTSKYTSINQLRYDHFLSVEEAVERWEKENEQDKIR